MEKSFWVVDTFSETPLSGCPSAVIFVDDFEDEVLMQNLSAELNAPETVFVKNFNNDDFEVICFTPNSCGMYFGSGLFAAAFVISTLKKTQKDVFNLILGNVVFQVHIVGANGVRIRFSSRNLYKLPMPDAVTNAIDGQIVVAVAESKGALIIEVRSPKKISNLTPNIDVLSHNIEHNVVIITADTHYESDVDYDFCARVFAPKLGVVEDSITPLAHLKLASYWHERIGKKNMIGFQHSQRPGYVGIEYDSDDGYTYLFGKHCIVAEGVLHINSNGQHGKCCKD